jgi:hypothetical protein
LTSILIPASVTSIESEVFSGCTGLTSVTFANKTGWSVKDYKGSTQITETQLLDPTTAATLLKSTYVRSTWTRS